MGACPCKQLLELGMPYKIRQDNVTRQDRRTDKHVDRPSTLFYKTSYLVYIPGHILAGKILHRSKEKLNTSSKQVLRYEPYFISNTDKKRPV